MSALGFKTRMEPLLAYFLPFTSGVTPADLLIAYLHRYVHDIERLESMIECSTSQYVTVMLSNESLQLVTASDSRVIPKINHSGFDASIVLKQNKFSKKVTSNRI